jgi:hypothetical protein
LECKTGETRFNPNVLLREKVPRRRRKLLKFKATKNGRFLFP